MHLLQRKDLEQAAADGDGICLNCGCNNHFWKKRQCALACVKNVAYSKFCEQRICYGDLTFWRLKDGIEHYDRILLTHVA